MITVTCNKPKIHDQWKLTKLLRTKWLAADMLRFAAVNGQFNIDGSGWPMVYRIPDAANPSMCWSGMPGLGAPEEIDGLLADVAPYLEEELIINVTGDRVGCWSVRPSVSNVSRFTCTVPDKRMMTITPLDHPLCNAGALQNYHCCEFELTKSAGDQLVTLAVHNRGYSLPVSITMTKDDALLLGLALVRAAAGYYSLADVQRAFEEHKFLIKDLKEKSDEESSTRDDGNCESGQ
jgi:hypothetical protein